MTIRDRLLAASQPEKINTGKPVIFIVRVRSLRFGTS
jgi:hypothetical protein